MSIKDLKEKIKHFLSSIGSKDLYISLIIILVALSSFGLGRLSKTNMGGPGLQIKYSGETQGNMQNSPTPPVSQNSSGKSILASKNGTKYYFTWCSGAGRIKEENKIWFSSEEKAQAAGFTKSSTCE